MSELRIEQQQELKQQQQQQQQEQEAEEQQQEQQQEEAEEPENSRKRKLDVLSAEEEREAKCHSLYLEFYDAMDTLDSQVRFIMHEIYEGGIWNLRQMMYDSSLNVKWEKVLEVSTNYTIGFPVNESDNATLRASMSKILAVMEKMEVFARESASRNV